jgi:hypothetical protein
VGIYQRTHKELTMQLNFTTNPQRTHQIPTRYILITWWVLFEKTLKELKTSGSGTLRAHYEVIFERNQGVLSQSIRRVLFGVNCERNQGFRS